MSSKMTFDLLEKAGDNRLTRFANRAGRATGSREGVAPVNKFVLLVLTFILTAAIGHGQPTVEVVDSPPDDQQAKIEGVYYSLLLSPLMKEKCPDLISFNITNVTGTNVGAVSKTEAVVGAGECTVTVDVKTRQHGSATLTLTFDAVAGGKYSLRPVYRGNTIAATIQNSGTGEFVARTWTQTKKKKSGEPSSLASPPELARNIVSDYGIMCMQRHAT